MPKGRRYGSLADILTSPRHVRFIPWREETKSIAFQPHKRSRIKPANKYRTKKTFAARGLMSALPPKSRHSSARVARPLCAISGHYTHGDHWGGVRGIVDEADERSGKVPVIAPVEFMDFTVSENVYAGNAMNRRLFYQYGLLLPASPHGYVGQGLGQGVSAGAVGLIAPTRYVEKDIEEFEVDGVKMVFQNTPNTEAPREMNTYIPDIKALWMAENVTSTLHNIYTLRGAPVRDPLRWSKYIGEALYRFGLDAEVMFASHHWPRGGNDRIQEVLRGQRDLYAHMNNQVLHLANQGVTINEIHNVYEVPKGLQDKWFCRGYHGSPQHNSRGVIQRYLGFWDCNPTTLIPLSPADSAPFYALHFVDSELSAELLPAFFKSTLLVVQVIQC
jgi:alkyl sulfatase BDS1-like metallo-beta-lactamase superfamily hydrolase